MLVDIKQLLVAKFVSVFQTNGCPKPVFFLFCYLYG